MTAGTFLPYPMSDRRPDVHVTGRRVVATVIDGLVLGGLYGALVALFGSVTSNGDHAEWTASMPPAAAAAYAVLTAGYYLGLERYRGQTLGKMVVGVRVVDRATGGRPRLGAVAIRTALRLVDGIAGYLVAFVSTLASSDRQRLGDRAAGTLVVAARQPRGRRRPPRSRPRPDRRPGAPRPASAPGRSPRTGGRSSWRRR